MSADVAAVGAGYDSPRLLAGGEWRRAGAGMPVIDPATAEPFAVAAASSEAEVGMAVASARAAAPAWAATSPSERGAVLHRWSELVRAHADDLSRIEARDIGKPASKAKRDVLIAASILRYMSGAADRIWGVTLPARTPDRFGYTVREPHGVSAVITPWNVPTISMASGAGASLACGNAVIVKPSELAPLPMLRMAELGIEAGLPAGTLSVVPGYGGEAGQALVAHPDVDHVSFTGSVPTGVQVMRTAAARVAPVKLELGGKTANVVFADADLDTALPQIADSILDNTGQNCYAGSRVVADARIAGEVVDGLRSIMERTSIGPWHRDPDMGPAVSEGQRDRILGFVERAQAGGARLVTGGTGSDGLPEGGFYVKPTLFAGVDPDMEIAQEEVFGPVQAVVACKGEDEAVDVANATRFGLMAVVWTRDLDRALDAVKRLDAGQVTVNEFANSAVIGLPFGTRKHSGFEGGSGYAAVREFTREKSVSIRHHNR